MSDYTKIKFAYSYVPADHVNLTSIMPSTIVYSNNTG